MTSRSKIRIDHLVRALERERVLKEQRTVEFYEKLEEIKLRGNRLLENKTKRLKSEGIDVDLDKIRRESKVVYLYSYMAPRLCSSSEDYTSGAGEDTEEEEEEEELDSDCESYQSNVDFVSYRNPDYELYRGTMKTATLQSIQENSVMDRLKNLTVTPANTRAPPTTESEGITTLLSSSKSSLDELSLPPVSDSQSRMRRVGTKLRSVLAFNTIKHKRKRSRGLLYSGPDLFGSSLQPSPDRRQIAVNGVKNVARAVRAIDSFKDHSKRRKSRTSLHKRTSSRNIFHLD